MMSMYGNKAITMEISRHLRGLSTYKAGVEGSLGSSCGLSQMHGQVQTGSADHNTFKICRHTLLFLAISIVNRMHPSKPHVDN